MRSNLTNYQTQNQTGTYVRGKNCYKFIHKTKTKYHSKTDTKCTFLHTSYTHTKHAIMYMDSLGNTHPLKVDRNLQWMSHHPTNPTYNPVLSGTMTHLSAWCQKQHHQDTQYKYIHPKGAYLAIWHTVCQHSENVTTVHVVPIATDHPNN